MPSSLTRAVWMVIIVTGPGVLAQTTGPAPSGSKPAGTSPLPPLPPSPIEQVRHLLAMAPAARQQFLAEKQTAHRQFLEAKLAEFDAMTEAECDARLQSLQLRYYLSLLMKLPGTNRNSVLSKIPAVERPLVEERLKLWDQLSPAQQKEFLEYEALIRAQVPHLNRLPREVVQRTYSPWDRARMERQIASWNALSPEKRVEIEDHVQRFFALSDSQKKRTVTALSHSASNALVVLEKLPPAERDRCLEGFRKFTELSPEERHEFLRAAVRWKRMDESQRQTWRRLADRLPSNFPLPPGFHRPPLPPGLKKVGVLPPSPAYATN